jgi:putative hydrolase of the HAD superfamily
MTIKTVFLDMGGTIDTFWFSPEMRLQATPRLQKLLSSAGINLHLTDEQLYELVTSGLDHYHQWRLRTLEEIPPIKVWCQYILADFPDNFYLDDSIAEDLMVWIETHYYRRQMRPEMPTVLEAIHNMGYKIGLISNVNSRGQVPLNLTQYGIKHYFNPIVLSSEYKRRKPDPSIFHYAARLANTPTSECIYIGDRISRDIVGAKRAGFKLAIQIQHDFKHGESDDGARPDLILKNMTEILEILHTERDRADHKHFDKKSINNQIRAVLFDAAGVLYSREDNGEELTSFLVKMGIRVDQVSISKLRHIRHLASIGQITYEEYKRAVLQLYGITDPKLIARGIQLSKEENNSIRYFDSVSTTLNTLKNKNFYLGIVTDTAQPLHIKISKLERGGFGSVWDSIISSQEVGVQKPDPKIYQLALQQLGIIADQAVFVGHKATELEGARNVGMKTVAFNYENGANADFYIKDFSELADLPILN